LYDVALRADFTIGGFIFYLTVENLKYGGSVVPMVKGVD